MNNMKKIYIFIILLLAFIIPVKANALTGTISLECDSFTKKVGENISCTLYGNSNEGVSAFESNIVKGDSLRLSNLNVSTIWQGDIENNSVLLYTDTNKTDKFELFTFNVTSDEVGESSLTFNNTYFTDSSFVRNVILNPNYTFTFISEEESQQNDDETAAEIVDDDTKPSSPSEEEIENPGSGSFIPLALVFVLSTIGVLIFFKVKNKKIYKL